MIGKYRQAKGRDAAYLISYLFVKRNKNKIRKNKIKSYELHRTKVGREG